MIKFKRVLLLEAHPDDVTVSAGGTIARIKRENPKVEFILDYASPCTIDPKNKGNIVEHNRACQTLGINASNVYSGYFDRDVVEMHKQELRNIYYKHREKFDPELVLCPTIHDFHQDHRAVADCALTIFRDTSTIIGYEILRSATPDFNPNLYIMLEDKDVSKKMVAIQSYKSQFISRPYFFSMDAFLSMLRMRGVQAKTQYAEAFELMWGRL